MFNQISFKTISSSSVFLLSILIHLDTMTMRPTTKGASNFTSKVLPTSLTGSTKTFSTRPWPTSESIASAQALGQSKHNQSEQQSQAGSGNQTKWYQGKPFKYGAGAGAVAGAGLLYKDYKDKESFEKREQSDDAAEANSDLYATFLRSKHESIFSKDISFEQWLVWWNKFWAETDNVAVVYPELYKVFLRIKEDLGISEDVPIRIVKEGSDVIGTAGGFFFPALDSIVLAAHYRTRNTSDLISTIVHELEHYKQLHKYYGSFHADFLEPYNHVELRVETAADAAAAGYFDCPECLKDRAYGRSFLKHDPRETDEGYITTEEGYFSKQDYDDYIKRAQCEGELCKAHRYIGAADRIIDARNAQAQLRNDEIKKYGYLRNQDLALPVKLKGITPVYGVQPFSYLDETRQLSEYVRHVDLHNSIQQIPLKYYLPESKA